MYLCLPYNHNVDCAEYMHALCQVLVHFVLSTCTLCTSSIEWWDMLLSISMVYLSVCRILDLRYPMPVTRVCCTRCSSIPFSVDSTFKLRIFYIVGIKKETSEICLPQCIQFSLSQPKDKKGNILKEGIEITRNKPGAHEPPKTDCLGNKTYFPLFNGHASWPLGKSCGSVPLM